MVSSKQSSNKLQPTSTLAHLTDPTNHTDSALVLSLILTTIESTGLERGTAVDGGVGGGADVKFGELVEFNLVSVVGVAFALGFDLSCLGKISLGKGQGEGKVDLHSPRS